jgi:hypothetical protein
VTREEHIAAAERFARENAGWTWDGRAHLMHTSGAVVRTCGEKGTRWAAFHPPSRRGFGGLRVEWIDRYGNARLWSFHNVEAAIASLSLAPESIDAR